MLRSQYAISSENTQTPCMITDFEASYNAKYEIEHMITMDHVAQHPISDND